jgi:hypothetical protein
MCSVDEKAKDNISQNEITGIWGLIETDHCTNSGRNVEALWCFFSDGRMDITCAPTSCDCGEDEEITEEMDYKIKGDEIILHMISSTSKDYPFYDQYNYEITDIAKYRMELNGLKLFIIFPEQIVNGRKEEGYTLEFEKLYDL